MSSFVARCPKTARLVQIAIPSPTGFLLKGNVTVSAFSLACPSCGRMHKWADDELLPDARASSKFEAPEGEVHLRT